jgi:hypothetical protein
MIGDTPTRYAKQVKNMTFGAVPNSGFTIVKNLPKFIKYRHQIFIRHWVTIIDCK